MPVADDSIIRSKEALRLWLKLLTTSHLIEQHVRTRLRREFGVTLPQFDLLSELEHAAQPQTMSEVSSRLLVSNGNVTGVVDRLVRAGLVRRWPASHDRRVQYIDLTERGRSLFASMAGAHEQWVTALFAELANDQVEQLKHLLDTAKKSVTISFAKGGVR